MQGASFGSFNDERIVRTGSEVAAAFPLCNAPSEFVRQTVKHVSRKASDMNRWVLPFGAIIHPLYTSQEKKVDYICFGSMEPIRCKRCKAYINPFCTFFDNGNKWCCNLCRIANMTPDGYRSALDTETGFRKDIKLHPELTQGIIDIEPTERYKQENIRSFSYCFVIDTSRAAVERGVVRIACSEIAHRINQLVHESANDSNICIITFNTKHVTVYKIGQDKIVFKSQQSSSSSSDSHQQQQNGQVQEKNLKKDEIENVFPSKSRAFTVIDTTNMILPIAKEELSAKYVND
ncbi:MAG: putative Sec23 protein transport family protein [Streblomastix strix]|uniref:Putative Sec23 protein transport family protein n=1 Tax=Streblomastix strix TaxID=222440 RepID=A0A5J4UK93_9EUKA|nr:MAG: putative Sec23 protein transport family protein [Streblomastix strix]